MVVMEILMGFFFILVIVSAVAVAELRDLLAAALALGACGFFVGILFFFMMAPDLAIVQLIVEIMMVVVLVIALARTHRKSSEPESAKTTLALGVIVVCVFLLFSVAVVPLMTEFGSPQYNPEVVQRYINEGVESTGSQNLVTAVLLDYRAYDTLGEIVVLFASVLGMSLVLRRVSKRMAEGKACL